MSVRTMLKLANGSDIDLRAPTAADYADFSWNAEHLAKEARFNGATPGIFYSVAQHMTIGATAILEETGEAEVAAYFTLHDCPEAVLRADTTPKKNALAEIAHERFGVLAEHIRAAYDELTDIHDRAIHEAAGLAWPTTNRIVAEVKIWDVRLFVTEWRDLMGNRPHPDWERYRDVMPLDRRIVPDASWQQSANTLLVLWQRLLPALRGGRP